MINTVVTFPRWPLSEDVRCIAIRQFNTFEEVLMKPMPAKHEIHLMFMINCRMNDFKNYPSNSTPVKLNPNVQAHCTFSGILTHMAGCIEFKGPVKLLVVHFTPTGFYTLFNISPKTIADRLGDTCDLLPNDILTLHDALQQAETDDKLFALAQAFLLSRKKLQRKPADRISVAKASQFMIDHPAALSIPELADQSNMSVKTFERHFIEQVGIAPKLFERIFRFHRTVEYKLHAPAHSWTKLCHQFGYYDQMHMIKDFYAFADASPSTFFNETPPPAEEIIEYGSLTSKILVS